MGLDMRPMVKAKDGYEERLMEIEESLTGDIPQKKGFLSFFDRLLGKKIPSREDLLREYFEIQISPYEAIQAPMVGRDKEADEWVIQQYKKMDPSLSNDDIISRCNGQYISHLAKEQDGVPVYIASDDDGVSFRGQFLDDCVEIIGDNLVAEAWGDKTPLEAIDYGNRLLCAVEKFAQERGLEYLKEQRMPPSSGEMDIETQVHIVYSLAKWLLFYGSRGHGYEADF